jgi:hypothetical protein
MVKKSGRAEGDPAGFLTQVIVRVWSVLTWEWETVPRVAENGIDEVVVEVRPPRGGRT